MAPSDLQDLPDLPAADGPPAETHYSPDLLATAHPLEPRSEPTPAASTAPAVRGSREAIDTRLVRRLADILKDTDLSELEVERGDLKIRVSRNAAAPLTPTLVAAPTLMAAPQALAPAAAPVAVPAAAPVGETLRGEQVKSPMVGAVYLQPQPDAAPFVKVGDTVTAGQTLLIIEAMKTMNPVPAPRGGVVLRILVENGQPVEFGEPLLVIE